MAGVLFIVSVPRTEFEKEIRTKGSPNIITQTDKYENVAKIIEELKINKRFSNIKTKADTYASDNHEVILSKCKSADRLRFMGNEATSQKSNNYNVFNETVGHSYRKCIKSSWGSIKHGLRPRRQKFKITNHRKEDPLLRSAYYKMSLEMILCDVLKRLRIETAAWSMSKDGNFWQVVFSLESGQLCEEVLEVLRSLGIGARYQSSVSIIPCALYYKSNAQCAETVTQMRKDIDESSWSRFASSVRARTNLAQVLHDVRTEAALTFDWLFLLIVAAFVAAIGLVENSTVILVASMLISPLMAPITAGTLGTSLSDRSLQRLGLQLELLGLFLSLVIGFIFGLAICAVDEHYGIGDWPTNEMMSRCEIRSLWVGILVAIPSGAGVALAVLGEYTASLVGVAISASLLPPAVNAGLLWAMSLVHVVYMDDETRWTAVVKTTTYSSNQAVELAVLGSVSLCLTLVNIVCIFLAGVAVYKIKEVSPMVPSDLQWWRADRGSRRYDNMEKRDLQNKTAAWDFYRWCQKPEDKSNIHVKNISTEHNNISHTEASSSNCSDVLPVLTRKSHSYCSLQTQIYAEKTRRSTPVVINKSNETTAPNSDIGDNHNTFVKCIYRESSYHPFPIQSNDEKKELPLKPNEMSSEESISDNMQFEEDSTTGSDFSNVKSNGFINEIHNGDDILKDISVDSITNTCEKYPVILDNGESISADSCESFRKSISDCDLVHLKPQSFNV